MPALTVRLLLVDQDGNDAVGVRAHVRTQPVPHRQRARGARPQFVDDPAIGFADRFVQIGKNPDQMWQDFVRPQLMPGFGGRVAGGHDVAEIARQFRQVDVATGQDLRLAGVLVEGNERSGHVPQQEPRRHGVC